MSTTRREARRPGRPLRPAGAAALALLLGACAAGRGAAPGTDADARAAAELGTRFDALRSERRIPGLAMVVLRGPRTLLARGFGFADAEGRVPVTAGTPFDVASVSKPLSAVVALKLAEDGVLDLDRPMKSFRDFDGFCEAARERGGVFFADVACADDRLTLRRVLSMSANGVPGTRFLYNPPLYSWASRPIAEAAGRPFSDLVESLVFSPAGMTRSARRHRTRPLRADLAADLARPFHVDADGRVVPSDPPPPQGDGAAGGVVSTALDLARFDVALEDGRLLTPGRRAELFTPTRTPSGVALPYGLGWFLGEVGGRRLAWHTGLWEGRYSALYLKVLADSPGERLTLILLANSEGLQWPTGLDEAAIERSPFATAFLAAFPAAPPRR